MKRILLAALLVLSISSVCFAGQAVLLWTAPSTLLDGSLLSLAQIQTYTIYYDAGTVTKTSPKVVLPITAQYPSLANMTYTATGLTTGLTYNFAVTCTDVIAMGGIESGLSNVVSKLIPYSAPTPPILSMLLPSYLMSQIYPGSIDEIMTFKISRDGVALPEYDPVVTAGGVMLFQDIASLISTFHVITVQACNAAGCSDADLPFSYTGQTIQSTPVGYTGGS